MYTDFSAPDGYHRIKEMTPVNGGPRGPTPPVRGRCPVGTEGVGMCGMEAGGSAEPPIAHTPWRLFGFFLGVQKETRPAGRNLVTRAAQVCSPYGGFTER